MRPAISRSCIVGLVLIPLLIISCEKRDSGNSPVGKAEPFSFKAKPTSTITFVSTQLNPVEEAGKMRNVILKDFPGKVDFRPNDSGAIFGQIEALRKANSLDAILIGAGHGDFVSLYEKGALMPLDKTITRLERRHIPETLLGLGRFNGKDPYYVPWMQASYIFVANKKALPYLPKNAKLDSLTYEQLYAWAGDIFRKTGTKALGFPAGKNGLMHRFFQGYLYPSYTASTLLKFRGAEARGMWGSFKSLWEYVNPSSLAYTAMAEPLLTGDVWIAWDHTARLIKAFKEKPDDFVAFPAPIGPKGRGYMLIVAGLAIPQGARDTVNQEMLIDYLTEPAIQERTLDETGFFPVVRAGGRSGLPHYLESVSAAVSLQTGSGGSVPTLAPIGLGERGTSYNNLFMLTFSRIVLEGEDAAAVLDANAKELQKLIDGANARCWLPDVSDKRPCKLE